MRVTQAMRAEIERLAETILEAEPQEREEAIQAIVDRIVELRTENGEEQTAFAALKGVLSTGLDAAFSRQ